MSNVVYKPLSSLAPLELKYDFFKEEDLNFDYIHFAEGLVTFSLEGLKKFQDSTVNRNTCLSLTDTVPLSSLFKTKIKQDPINRFPVTVKLKSRQDQNKFLSYNKEKNVFELSDTDYSIFYLDIDKNTRQTEIFVSGNFLQVLEQYPHQAVLREDSLDPEEIERQRFSVVHQGGFISFRVRTSSGYRCLGIGPDNILRASGCVFNRCVVNDYIFGCEIVTNPDLIPGFIPQNNWVSYFADNESRENRTTNINKNELDVNTNFLIDFPVEKSVKEGIAYINVANLKTQVTPNGSPVSIT